MPKKRFDTTRKKATVNRDLPVFLSRQTFISADNSSKFKEYSFLIIPHSAESSFFGRASSCDSPPILAIALSNVLAIIYKGAELPTPEPKSRKSQFRTVRAARRTSGTSLTVGKVDLAILDNKGLMMTFSS